MASSTTWTVVLDELLASEPVTVSGEIPLGYKFTGTATSGGATLTSTDPELGKLGTQALSTRLAAFFIYIPTGTTTDPVHTITSISVSGLTTTITTLGNYAATYTSVAMYLLRVHPTVLRNLGNEALNRLKVRCYAPLYHGPTDGDMQASGVTNWTASGGTPFAKQTTAAEVFEGARSGAFTDAGSGGDYTQSALINVATGTTLHLFAVAKADVGTGSVSVLDASGNVLVTVSFTQEDWLFIHKQFSVSVEQVRVRLTGVTAAAQLDVQSLGIVKADQGRFVLPSYLTSRYTPVGVYCAEFRTSGAEADTYVADSFDWIALRYGLDYSFQRSFAAANSYIARVDPAWMNRPLYFAYDAPWSAPYGVSATFSADTDTTGCPPHLLIAGCKILLGERYENLKVMGQQGLAEMMTYAGTLEPVDAVPQSSGWAGMFRGGV